MGTLAEDLRERWDGGRIGYGETVAEVVEFAEHFRLDEPSEVEVIEV